MITVKRVKSWFFVFFIGGFLSLPESYGESLNQSEVNSILQALSSELLAQVNRAEEELFQAFLLSGEDSEAYSDLLRAFYLESNGELRELSLKQEKLIAEANLVILGDFESDLEAIQFWSELVALNKADSLFVETVLMQIFSNYAQEILIVREEQNSAQLMRQAGQSMGMHNVSVALMSLVETLNAALPKKKVNRTYLNLSIVALSKEEDSAESLREYAKSNPACLSLSKAQKNLGRPVKVFEVKLPEGDPSSSR